MTDREKLNAISWICLSHIGDKHSLTEKIRKVISMKKVVKRKSEVKK